MPPFLSIRNVGAQTAELFQPIRNDDRNTFSCPNNNGLGQAKMRDVFLYSHQPRRSFNFQNFFDIVLYIIFKHLSAIINQSYFELDKNFHRLSPPLNLLIKIAPPSLLRKGRTKFPLLLYNM